mmetsp:Transcript_102177/g.288634  ORF Transcript_102177/g.288634 Transcript_102177/m.288634 type:complete len:232 (+) Transcript_102177:881-1576(+)
MASAVGRPLLLFLGSFPPSRTITARKLQLHLGCQGRRNIWPPPVLPGLIGLHPDGLLCGPNALSLKQRGVAADLRLPRLVHFAQQTYPLASMLFGAAGQLLHQSAVALSLSLPRIGRFAHEAYPFAGVLFRTAGQLSGMVLEALIARLQGLHRIAQLLTLLGIHLLELRVLSLAPFEALSHKLNLLGHFFHFAWRWGLPHTVDCAARTPTLKSTAWNPIVESAAEKARGST